MMSQGVYNMEELIDFFIQIGRLKKTKRRGWMIHEIKNAESTASHIFRVVIIAWVLGRRGNFNLEKILKMSLIHDLCEVYGPDLTPYDPLLPKNLENRVKIREILKSYPKLSLEQKEKRVVEKVKLEEKGLKQLVFNLPKDLQEEIINLWQEFTEGLSFEAKFVKQVDKVENLLQGLEYWQKYGKIQKKLWLRWMKEIINAPILIEFVEAIEKKFETKKTDKIKGWAQQKWAPELDFFIEIGKLKRMPRRGWVISKIKNPESITEHIFRAAIITWVLGKKKGLNREKLLKMILIHDLCEVYAGDITPYDPILPRNEKKLTELIKTWPRFSKIKKRKIDKEKYKKEWQALVKLTAKLSPKLKKEIRSLWFEFRKGLTKEGRFACQADRIENLLQALEYAQETKQAPYKSWWIGSQERIDDPFLIEFMEELDKKFYDQSIFRFSDNSQTKLTSSSVKMRTSKK